MIDVLVALLAHGTVAPALGQLPAVGTRAVPSSNRLLLGNCKRDEVPDG
jgi:hypothetical protein